MKQNFQQHHRWICYSFLGIFSILVLLSILNEKNWRPLKNKPTWNASSSNNPLRADLAIDRNIETAWSSQAPMNAGMFYQVTLETQTLLNGILFHVGKDRDGQPAEWIIKASVDNEHWHTIVPQRHITYRSMLAIFFQPVRIQSLQIIQTSMSVTRSPWLIHELDLLTPIVPWQFSRATYIFFIVGWVLIGTCVLLCRHYTIRKYLGMQSTAMHHLVCALLIGMLVLGWGWRVFHIEKLELSSEEISLLPAIKFRETDYQRWFAKYQAILPDNISRLSAFSIRQIYHLFQTPRTSLRIIPAMLGSILSFCMFFVVPTLKYPRRFLRNAAYDVHYPYLWEALLLTALVNFSAFFIWIGRRGDFSIVTLLFSVIYLACSYHFLYQQSTHLWLPLLSIISLSGYAYEPVFAILPAIVIMTSGLALLQSRQFVPTPSPNITRWVLWLLSIFPLVLALGVLYGLKWQLLPEFSLNRHMFSNVSQAMASSGFTGKMSWLWWGIVFLGFWHELRQQASGIRFFVINLLLFGLLCSGFSASHHIPAVVLMLLLFILLAKGLYASCYWFLKRFTGNTANLHSPLYMGTFILIVLYFAGFTYNSLFAGYEFFPYSRMLFQQHTQAQQLDLLLARIQTDSYDCKIFSTPDRDLSLYFPMIHGIEPEYLDVHTLQTYADSGRFWTYLLLTHNDDLQQNPEIQAYLTRHYTLYGTSNRIAIYRLQEQELNQTQHYPANALLSNVGDYIQDERLSGETVLVAQPDDVPGLLVYWPSLRICEPGRYTLRFSLRSQGGADSDVIGVIEVFADAYTLLARREITAQNFPDPNTYYLFDIEIELEPMNPAYKMKRIHFPVHVTGKAEVRLGYIDVIPANRDTLSQSICE